MAFSTINKSTDYQNTVLYSGDGNATQTITNTFQTDFSWIKDRGVTAAHTLQDAVRGFDVTKKLSSNSSDAENNSSGATWGNYGGVTSVGATSFTTSLGSSTPYQTNASGSNYVAWNWKAGTTSGIDTTGATITPTGYSFNATSKMSIIKYTGNDTNNAAVPHGLGVVPNCIIVKDLSGTEHWAVVTTSMTAGKMMYLNLTNAEETSQFGSTANTSVLFHLGTNAMVNSSSKDYIAYCFADVQGYSKFGSYTGNGNADGAFVYTGFKPSFVMIKQTSGTNLQSWWMIDNKRDTYNVCDENLRANENNAASESYDVLDIVSNGFKTRWSDTAVNGSGVSYIYMAFGQPIISNGGVCATAR